MDPLVSQDVCREIVDECLNDVFKKPLRCKKCFVTHFPWMKICKRNNPIGWDRINVNKSMESDVMVPKLRGGAIQPKYFDTDSHKIRDMLAVLRSLDIFTQLAGHPKCELTSRSELCKFCLVRSLVIKSRNNKGHKKVAPIELNAFNQEVLKNMDLEQSISVMLDDELHLRGKIFNHSECSECFPEATGEEFCFYYHLQHPSIEGHDVLYLFQEVEKDYQRDHAHHDKLKQDGAQVMFARFDYGVSVNFNENLTYRSKVWKVKSVKTKTKCFFLQNNQFYELKEDGCVLFGDPNVNEVIFVAFEKVNEGSEADTEDLTYKNNETKKLHGMFDTRTRKYRPQKPRMGDRHNPREGDRHLDPKKDRHRNRRFEAISEDIKIDTGMERICCVCAELRYIRIYFPIFVNEI